MTIKEVGWSVRVIGTVTCGWGRRDRVNDSMVGEVRSGAVMARSSGISWGCASATVRPQRWGCQHGQGGSR
jgi:hypothetical protein